MIQLQSTLILFTLTIFTTVATTSIKNATNSLNTISTLAAQTNISNPEGKLPEFRVAAVLKSEFEIYVSRRGKIKIPCDVKSRHNTAVNFYKLRKHKWVEVIEEPPYVTITHNKLVISNANIGNSGNYKCVATNSNGKTTLQFSVRVQDQEDLSDTSNGAPKSDTVNASTTTDRHKIPRWVNEQKMQKRLHAEPAGNTVSFRCAVQGARPITVDWYKDGEEIKKNGRLGGYKFRQRNQQISLESVVMSDRAKYMCVAHNKYGSINYTYELDVVGQPTPSRDTQSNQIHPPRVMN